MASRVLSQKNQMCIRDSIKVMEMMNDIRAHVSDVTDEDEMRAYIGKIVDKEAFDHKRCV